MATGANSDCNTSRIVNSAIEERIAYQFQQAGLLQQALTHRSFSATHNERLEFLGDSVLNLSIAANLYRRFPAASEGDLSRMLANLVNGETLAEIAAELQLGDSLSLGAGESSSGGRRRQSILADVLEALLGAVYLDADFSTADQLAMRLFESRILMIDPDKPVKDAKTMLQERLQASQQPLPAYQVLKTWGQAHQRQFEVSCRISLLEERFTGQGGSRREAEQQAAYAALQRLNNE